MRPVHVDSRGILPKKKNSSNGMFMPCSMLPSLPWLILQLMMKVQILEVTMVVLVLVESLKASKNKTDVDGELEIELSLMHDILYTKAAMVHIWFGYCIRIVSVLTVSTLLLLFWFSIKAGYNRSTLL